MKDLHEDSAWSTFEKITFRFIFIFFSCFILLVNNDAYPFLEYIIKYPKVYLNRLTVGLAEYLFNTSYEADVSYSGSGDTGFYHILLLFIFLMAFVGGAIWTLRDRKRNNYNRLYYWLTVAVRLYVGSMLIQYGLVKVVKLQLPFPDLNRLTTTYGDSSPMGLAWTFLGYSYGYNLFMGCAELLAVLLFFRKTVTIGAIICLMTTANVLAVNYFYDVPVKILSTALVVMCLYLLAPNFSRLYKFFIRTEPVGLKIIKPPFTRTKRLSYIITGIKCFVIAGAFIPLFTMINSGYGDASPKLPLYGLYNAETIVWNNDTLAADVVDARRWKSIMIQRTDYSGVKYMNGETEYCNLTVDTLHKKLHLTFKEDLKTTHHFNYQLPDSSHLILSGTLFDQNVYITLKKQKFQLMERKFNWITQLPYNK